MPVMLTDKPRTRKVRKSANAATDVPRVRVDDLIRKLGSRDPSRHPEIVQELNRLGDALLPSLTARLGSRRTLRGRLCLMWFVVQIPEFAAMFMGAERYAPFHSAGMAWRSVFLLLAFVTVLYGTFPRYHATILRLLIQMDDIRTLPTLIEVQEDVTPSTWSTEERRRISSEVHAALVRLLPRLSYADRDLLEEKQHKRLRQILKTSMQNPFIVGSIDSDLVFAIVKALVQIRDTESRDTLRNLAKKSRDANTREIAMLGLRELLKGATP